MRDTPRSVGWFSLGTIAVVIACRPTPDATVPDPAPIQTEPAAPSIETETEPDPMAELEQLESRLVASESRVRFTVVAEGAIDVKLQGMLWLSADRVELRTTGAFAGEPVELGLVADGTRMRSEGAGPRFDLPEAPELRDALAVGLVRMGILHNIAVMRSGRPPDHAQGGVRQWVQAEEVRRERGTEASSAPVAGAEAVSFSLWVAGKPSGSVTLWRDPQSGLPLKRDQRVVFPDGEMRVTETYQWGC